MGDGTRSLPLLDLHNIARHLPVSLERRGSHSSSRSGIVPSPRLTSDMLPPSSAPSSASGSRSYTPKLLSRRNSAKEKIVIRQGSIKGKGKEVVDPNAMEGLQTPASDSGSIEVMETAFLNIERDPETGRKMINQYLVLQELGHGTHGRVRLGRDMSHEFSSEDGLHHDSEPIYYAIKIVDRAPKKKRLAGFSRQKALLARTDGGKLLNENEIRKEIAIFKKVNHPNVVRMKEIIDAPDSSKIFMILEYCEGGELRWKNEDGTPSLTLEQTRRIFRDTLLGLEYLHHQGIIHRDIKPSNLLFFGDTVKISDFGCSHYSEALRVASSQGLEGEGYVDDLELAKTAGSPAFFAPEMCYSGEIPNLSPHSELPGFTLRPPSVAGDPGETKASRSDPLVVSPGGHTIPLKPSTSNDSGLSRRPVTVPRTPITNAIDVWALGVTLYCLLFGRTPFDAPNEYLLMQVIPTADYEILPTLGSDRMDVQAPEAQECLDLLARLLEKNPFKRISLETAKKHPFTLRGLSDPSAWLARTDPHAQSFVTVSNDEVAAVIVKSRIGERVRRGIRSISNKLLQPLGGRHRSRSIGDSETHTSVPTREPSPMTSPMPTIASPRRRSILGFRQQDMPSPRPSQIQLASPQAIAPVRSFSVNRNATTHLRTPASPTLSTPDPPPIRPVLASSSSLDKLRVTTVESSPPSVLHRRQSSDLNIEGRHRSTSNASSTAFGLSGKLIRMISRTSSQRSRFRRQGEAESEEAGPSIDRLSLDEGLPRRSMETFDSGSYSSGRGGVVPSPDRFNTGIWESRMKRQGPIRRGSNLSEDFARGVQEEVDWDGSISDGEEEEEEYVDMIAPPRSTLPGLPPLEPIPDASPAPEKPFAFPVSPTTPISSNQRSPSRTSSRMSQSPLRPLHIERARSPLRTGLEDFDADDDHGLAFSIGSKRGRRPSVVDKQLASDGSGIPK